MTKPKLNPQKPGRKKLPPPIRRIGFPLRLPAALAAEFRKACRARGEKPSEVLERFAKAYVLEG